MAGGADGERETRDKAMDIALRRAIAQRRIVPGGSELTRAALETAQRKHARSLGVEWPSDPMPAA